MRKITPKKIFCPGGGGGAPWKWNGFGSGMERAPRPHPQGKKSFFGVIFAQNYAIFFLSPIDLFRLISMRGARICCRNRVKRPGTQIFLNLYFAKLHQIHKICPSTDSLPINVFRLISMRGARIWPQNGGKRPRT